MDRDEREDDAASEGRRPARAAQFAAFICVALLGLALAVALLVHSERRLAWTNGIPPGSVAALLDPGHRLCQRNVLLPEESSSARVKVISSAGGHAKLEATLRRGDAVLGRSTTKLKPGRGYVVVTYPRRHSSRSTLLCFTAAGSRRIIFVGESPSNGRPVTRPWTKRTLVVTNVRVEVFRSRDETLLSLLPMVFRRASLFRPAWLSPWMFYLLPLIWLGLFALSASLVMSSSSGGGTGAGRNPWRSAVLVGIVAFLNAAAWATVIPAFHNPDEPAHYAYVEELAQHGGLPGRAIGRRSFSNEEALALDDSGFYRSAGNIWARPPWNVQEESKWRRVDAELGQARFSGGGGSTAASGYTPLYYGLEAVPYLLAAKTDIFTRLWLMRIFSALLGAITAALCFLAVRELAPEPRWAAIVAGLAVALQPLLGAISGSVNNDALVTTFAAAALLLVFMGFRRGLSLRLASLIGLVVGLAVVVKPTIAGLAPPIVGAVMYLSLKHPRDGRRWTPALAFAFMAATPILIWLGMSAGVLDRPASGFGSGTARPFNLFEFASYVWRWYLPKLPFMSASFGEALSTQYGLPAIDVWIRGFWGGYGHLNVNFPRFFYYVLFALTIVGLGGLASLLVKVRKTIKQRFPEIVFCTVAVVSQLVFIHLAAYVAFLQNGEPFAQGRYLFPLMPVFGLALSLLMLRFRNAVAPVAAAALVASLALLDFFAMGLTLSRFYT